MGQGKGGGHIFFSKWAQAGRDNAFIQLAPEGGSVACLFMVVYYEPASISCY